MRKSKAGGLRQRAGWGLAAAALVAVVLWLTVREDRYVTWQNLTGGNFVPLEHHWAALRCVWQSCPNEAAALYYLLVDVVGNFVLFVPVGFTFAGAVGGPARWRRWLWAVLAAFVLSLGIESVQYFLPSRATDVDDVLFNTLGAMLGAGVAPGRGGGPAASGGPGRSRPRTRRRKVV